MKKLAVLMLVLAAAASVPANGAVRTETAAAKTTAAVSNKADFDYDRAYYSDDRRLVYKENGDTAYVTNSRIIIFDKNGKQTKDLAIDLKGKTPKLYFNNGNYHYFLTGELSGNKLNYTLIRFDEFGGRTSKTLSVDCNPEFSYKSAFSKGGLRYLKGEYMAFFEVVPDAKDNRKASDEKAWDVRRSPVEYFGFQLNPLYEFEDSEKLRENPLFKEMLSGIYENIDYDNGSYDFLIGGNGQKPEMLFNGTDKKTGSAYEWGDREIFKQAYENSKTGLFFCKNKRSGRTAEVYAQPIVESYSKNSLIVGDIAALGGSVITTGKDYGSAKNFKNAFISYYDDDMKNSKKNFITAYKLSDGVKVSTPYIIKKDASKAWAVWYETKGGETVFKYGRLTQSGKIDGSINTVSGDIVPVRPVYRADKLYYITNDKTKYTMKNITLNR